MAPHAKIVFDLDTFEPIIERAVRKAIATFKQQLPADKSQTTKLLLTHEEAALALSVSQRSLSTYVESGDLSQVRLGPRTIRYSLDDLQAFIQENKTVSQINNKEEIVHGKHPS
ncbi:MAG: helix-turn-helix domain-containing protein [Pirellulaceae bacterium]|jgi:excisionase family DNA binding protein|nr:helix-turn-helix domain-containing protein [Pirellulaceae bacterium]HJN12609.1 helix-turn-helix domain-containing protein [Pirellulaceae bacterium]